MGSYPVSVISRRKVLLGCINMTFNLRVVSIFANYNNDGGGDDATMIIIIIAIILFIIRIITDSTQRRLTPRNFQFNLFIL